MIIGVIPARMGSSRFPGKPLHLIRGVALVERCYQRATKYGGWGMLVVASPDNEIVDYCYKQSIPCVWTPRSMGRRALDCVAAAAESLRAEPKDIVVNVQGDEPLVDPDDIRLAVENSPCIVSHKIRSDEELYDPNTVKVVSVNGRFVYSSRYAIPYGAKVHYRIAGLMAMPMAWLEVFTNGEETELERDESCDMNRALSYGLDIRVAVGKGTGVSVDCRADVEKVSDRLG